MEITYQHERKDYWQYNKFIIGRIPALKYQVIVSSLIFPAVVVSYLWYFNVVDTVWLFLLGIAAFAFWIALTTRSRKVVFLKAVESKPDSLGLHTVVLNTKGFHQQSAVMETIVEWLKVTEVAENDKLICFLLGQRFGFFIPKRFFQTAEQAQVFLETAHAYYKSAVDGTEPVLPTASPVWPPAPQRIAS